MKEDLLSSEKIKKLKKWLFRSTGESPWPDNKYYGSFFVLFSK